MYLYAANKQEETTLRIPKILHFVWISRPIPPKYIAAIEKFENDNRDYEVANSLAVNGSLEFFFYK